MKDKEPSGNPQTPPAQTEPTTDTDTTPAVTEASVEPAPANADDTVTDYQLSLSENSLLTKDNLESLTGFAKENKLSNEAATSLLKDQEELLGKYHSRLQTNHDETVKKWEEENKNDTAIGGDNWETTQANINRFMETCGSDELKELFENTGYKHYPAVVKALNKAGAMFAPDKLKLGGSVPPIKQQSVQDQWYGGTTPA